MSVVCEVGSDCGCGFKNTGADYNQVWEKFHQIIDKDVDCEECNDHGHLQINGLRDHIKVGIGGKPYNPANYERFVKEVNCVWRKFS